MSVWTEDSDEWNGSDYDHWCDDIDDLLHRFSLASTAELSGLLLQYTWMRLTYDATRGALELTCEASGHAPSREMTFPLHLGALIETVEDFANECMEFLTLRSARIRQSEGLSDDPDYALHLSTYPVDAGPPWWEVFPSDLAAQVRHGAPETFDMLPMLAGRWIETVYVRTIHDPLVARSLTRYRKLVEAAAIHPGNTYTFATCRQQRHVAKALLTSTDPLDHAIALGLAIDVATDSVHRIRRVIDASLDDSLTATQVIRDVPKALATLRHALAKCGYGQAADRMGALENQARSRFYLPIAQ